MNQYETINHTYEHTPSLDPAEEGGLGKCIAGNKPMPTCKAVLKNDSHPPPQSFECSETEKKCVRILDRSGEYVELKDCIANCKF